MMSGLLRNASPHASSCLAGATLACALLFGAPAAAQAAECLSHEQMREAIAHGHAVDPTVATRAARGASAGDVLRVRLCRHDSALSYHITTLRRDGRVSHVTIEGVSGKVSAVR
jgi:uncharacterized membrane protein YkoI